MKMITWSGWIIAVFGTAHTLGALFALGAARHAGAWFSGELWSDDLSDMSPANSAYWLSLESFGPQLILMGLTVVWMGRRGIVPPLFIGWTLGVWTVVDTVVLGFGFGQGMLFVLAVVLLLVGSYRAKRSGESASGAAGPPLAEGATPASEL
jgi:hypothetical protein